MTGPKRRNSTILGWCLLVIIQSNVHAGPVVSRSHRRTREVYPEIETAETDVNQSQAGQAVCVVGDVVYEMDEPVPAEQPCLKCRCQPPGVQCETIRCGAKRPGCKAIHRPNKCCPEYQCECKHEGKIYANGERLETRPGGECKVCYCRGGEVQCTEVTCYIRTDCEAKTVPGQCCPKYDNCPPKEPLLERPGSYVVTDYQPADPVNKEVLEVWPITTLLQNTSEQSANPTIYETQEANKILDSTPDGQTSTVESSKPAEHPKITIHEIIPEVKEIAITAPSKLETQGQLFIEEQHKEPVDSTINDVVVTDSEPDSSEISEVFQHPPPVLRIGDKLLFLKQGELVSEQDASTPSTVITLIGAEGLQRGFEENSAEAHETRQPLFSTNTNDLEPKTSESTHILSLVKTKKKQLTTTVPTPTTTEINPVDVTPTVVSNLEVTTSTVQNETQAGSKSETEQHVITEKTVSEKSTVSAEIVTTTIKPEPSSPVEENPAYPSIPDFMEHDNDKTRILTDVLEIRSNKTLPSNVSHGEWLKNETVEETLVNFDAIIPEEILRRKAFGDFEDVAVATELTTLNSTTEISAVPTTVVTDGIPSEHNTILNSTTEIGAVPATVNTVETPSQKVTILNSTTEIGAVPATLVTVETPSQKVTILNSTNEIGAVPTTVVTVETPSEKTQSETTTSSANAVKSLPTTVELQLNNVTEEVITVSTSTEATGDMTTEIPNNQAFGTEVNTDKIVQTESKSVEVADQELQTEPNAEQVTESEPKSVESLEDATQDDSGESTTPKSIPQQAQFVSDENASVEPSETANSEVTDMLATAVVMNSNIDDIEAFNDEAKSKQEASGLTTTQNPMAKDVEMITESLTSAKSHKLVPTPTLEEVLAIHENQNFTRNEKLELLPKIIGKRESSPEDEADEVFKQLDDELNGDGTQGTLTEEEEKKESDRIFQELLEETSTPKPKRPLALSKDQETLQRVSEAIASVTLGKKGTLDGNILTLLTDFFGSDKRVK